VRADKSLILLADVEKERLTRVVGHGYTQAQLNEHTFEEFQDGISGWVLREKVPTLSVDIQTDKRNRGKALASARQSSDRSAAIAPLLIEDEVIGTLAVVNSQQAKSFRLDDLNLVTMLAGQAAIAIQNARLYEAAQEADRLKSAFLASMSHELRTPLNSIIGFTGIILQGLAGPLNPEQEKQLNMVRDSSRHLLNLINDVLDISKIEAGQLETISEPFDMREAIAKVARTMMPMAEKKGLDLVAEVSPAVGQITSDRRRVEQILINLVNNAIKFTDQGEVRVESEISGNWLVTHVVDTGIGIKPEDMDKLFKAFRQIDSGIDRQHEGTGLGLSICKRLVEMLGGQVWGESKWGVGSTFTFTLPINRG
jgi:signal transduction histidine kinase